MLSKQKYLLTCCLAGIVSLLITSVSVAQSAATSKSPVRYFAVMGEVVQPGVYEIKSSSPYLSNLIRISGGLTKNATGHLRIIRQGRPGQQTYFTPSLNIQLLPGDVIVADSKRITQKNLRVVEFSKQKQQGKKVDQEHVQLGFINLIDRPVVVKVRRDLATIPLLIKMLGQPAETSKSVRVISSSRQRRETASIPNCSLIVFEKPVLLPKNLPNLPASLNQAQGETELAHAGPIGIDEPAPPKSVTEVQQQPKSDQPLMLTGPMLFHNDGNDKNKNVPDKGHPEVVLLPAPDSTNSVVETSETDSHLIVESKLPSQPTKAPAPPIEILPTGPTLLVDDGEGNSLSSELDAMASSMTEDTTVIDVTTPPQASSENQDAITYLLGALLILGGGIFVWAVAPHKISHTEKEQVKAKQNVVESIKETKVAYKTMATYSDTEALEAIINNELPIVTEQVVLPVSLEFYGHSTGQEKLRIDSAHAMAEPHFNASIPQPVAQDEASQLASAMMAPGIRIDPAINLEGSAEATRSPMVPPATSINKQSSRSK